MAIKVDLERRDSVLTQYQGKDVTLILNDIQQAIYLNQVIEAMRSYFNSPYGPYNNYYHFPPSYAPVIPSFSPLVYVYYNSPPIQTNFSQKQMQMRSNASYSFYSNSLECPPKVTSDEVFSFSSKSLSQEVTKREQKSLQEPSKINIERTITAPGRNSPQIQITSPKPQENRFVKKNTQSNIVSQIFSFLWSPDKNYQYLPKVFSNQEQIKAFQLIMRNVKVKCKTQLNRSFLKRLLQAEQWPATFKKLLAKVRGHQSLSSEEIQLAIRKLSFFYLRELHLCSIMTSKKMNKRLWANHFKKCKQIKDFLFSGQEK